MEKIMKWLRILRHLLNVLDNSPCCHRCGRVLIDYDSEGGWIQYDCDVHGTSFAIKLSKEN